MVSFPPLARGGHRTVAGGTEAEVQVPFLSLDLQRPHTFALALLCSAALGEGHAGRTLPVPGRER